MNLFKKTKKSMNKEGLETQNNGKEDIIIRIPVSLNLYYISDKPSQLNSQLRRKHKMIKTKVM